jgi:hypothetical protein
LHTQLFDLKKDPWEIRDLSGDPGHAGRIREMRVNLRNEMTRAQDDLDIEKADWGRRSAGRKGRGS